VHADVVRREVVEAGVALAGAVTFAPRRGRVLLPGPFEREGETLDTRLRALID
jgi:hypothetical protein